MMYPYGPEKKFQCIGKHVFKVATIIYKNMLPIGSIFFPLKVTPMRIKNNLCNKLRNRQINLRCYVSLLQSPNFDAANISGLQYFFELTSAYLLCILSLAQICFS